MTGYDDRLPAWIVIRIWMICLLEKWVSLRGSIRCLFIATHWSLERNDRLPYIDRHHSFRQANSWVSVSRLVYHPSRWIRFLPPSVARYALVFIHRFTRFLHGMVPAWYIYMVSAAMTWNSRLEEGLHLQWLIFLIQVLQWKWVRCHCPDYSPSIYYWWLHLAKFKPRVECWNFDHW